MVRKRKNRDKIILASKVAGPGCDWIRGGGNNFDEKKIGEAIDGSLKRLKTDYIDLYQLHWPERSTNFLEEETICLIIKREIGIVLKVYLKLWKNI